MAVALVGCGGESTASKDPAGGTCSVVITDAGDRKINAIKMVREVTGLGLEDAKDLVDSVPSVIMERLSAEQAQSLAVKLESAGMKVEVRSK